MFGGFSIQAQSSPQSWIVIMSMIQDWRQTSEKNIQWQLPTSRNDHVQEGNAVLLLGQSKHLTDKCKGVAERGFRTKGGRGEVWLKAEKNNCDLTNFDD